jgi:hypothetical protein
LILLFEGFGWTKDAFRGRKGSVVQVAGAEDLADWECMELG